MEESAAAALAPAPYDPTDASDVVVDPAVVAAMSVEGLRELHRHLLGRLRDVEHWHRLVGARLDLAVAAVTDLDEPRAQRVTPLPCDAVVADLHALLGIPRSEGRLAESGRLLDLRAALRELELTACSLQADLSMLGRELARRGTERVVLHLPQPRRPH